MRKYFDKHGLDGSIESAGTEDWNVGRQADERAVRVSRQYGVDITEHRARQVRARDFSEFDAIFAMDSEILRKLKAIVPPSQRDSVRLLFENTDIADPYHGDEAGFHHTFKIIDKCCKSIVELELVTTAEPEPKQ